MIEERLSNHSSTEEIFDRCKPVYQKALEDAGYKYKLKYQPPKPKKRKRKRDIIYFNPPFCKSVKTNVIKTFLSLIDKHFPKNSKLHKCFNRNNVKSTYCTLPNLKQKINSHNAKILSTDSEIEIIRCNCIKKEKDTCPMPGECKQKNVIYQADVHVNGKIMTYFRSSVDFKQRY